MVPLGAISIWMLVTKGSYRFVEGVLLVACLVYVGYIVSGIMAKPDWGSIAKHTFSPRLQWNSEYIMLSIAIIGTTITPWMQFYLQSSIVEKGITLENYKFSRLDVITGCLLTDIISFFIIVTCGALLFPHGIRIHEATEAAIALRPLAGDYASLIFALSLANASLLGAIIVPISTAYYICEAMGWEAGVNKTFKEAPQFMWIYTLMIVLAALLILIPGAPLVLLMVLSSLVNGLLLPFVLIYALSLINNKELMGKYANPKSYNYIAWGAVAVISCLTLLLILTMIFPLGGKA
jgi:Mn2+/Fe2+ NRAMP family transporter